MGVYQGDMIFGQAPPITLPKLGIAFWLISDIDDRPSNLVLRLLGIDKTEIIRFTLGDVPDMVNPEGASKRSVQGSGIAGPILIAKEGFLELWIDTDKGSLRAGRLRIQFLESKPATESAS
jgi:hypothetical protein